MAKQGEIDYLKNIGPAGVHHAAFKPFSDPECYRYLFEIGAVMSLLPPPPAQLLDAGCGTGWTSVFFAKRGYAVTGTDISPDMIEQAKLNKEREGLENLTFVVADYEEITFDNQFDTVVFFDSLHHAVDAQAAVGMAFRALKFGGVCVTAEPGEGHGQNPVSLEHVQKYNVSERDMPPSKIIALGRGRGFRTFKAYPHGYDFCNLLYVAPSQAPDQVLDKTVLPALEAIVENIPRNGITVLVK